MPRLSKSVVDALKPKAGRVFRVATTARCSLSLKSRKKSFYASITTPGDGVRRRDEGCRAQGSVRSGAQNSAADLGPRGWGWRSRRGARRAPPRHHGQEKKCRDYMGRGRQGNSILGKRGQPKKPSTVRQDHARINRHIDPLLGRKIVRDLTSVDVRGFIRAVTLGKTAVVEKTKARGKAVVTGGAGTAARAANFLGAVLTYAVNEGIIERNVAHGVKRQADRRRVRLLSPDEYGSFGRAIREAEQAGETWQAVAGSQLLALSPCRLGEIITLRWSEVDAYVDR